MKVIICDKCKKPINIKDVRHIVVRTEEIEHILDFCNCCYFAIAESIESLKTWAVIIQEKSFQTLRRLPWIK